MTTLRWLSWSIFTAAWTAALLLPVPQPPDLGLEGYDDERRFLFGKTLHVTAYAVLTILSAWLRVSPRYRWLLVFFVTVHGTATELLQAQLGYRDGSLRDVGLDNLGVLIGLALAWQWWTNE